MTELRRGASLTVALFAVLGIGVADAAPKPAALVNTDLFEVFQGDAPRARRRVIHNPTWHHAAWQHFLTTEGGTWRSMWDPQTRVPLRIYGSGLPAPGSVASPAKAEAFALTLLRRHIGLLAPGASAGDFVLVSNQVTNGVRSVGFLQYSRGVRVLGGQISFRFKVDRMVAIASEALPSARATRVTAPINDARAGQSALSWLGRDFGAAGKTVRNVSAPVILPIIRNGDSPGTISYHTVVTVTVASTSPIARWDVHVDARTGTPVARRQTLAFGDGVILYNAPDRWPGGSRSDYPAAFASQIVDGTPTTADVNGSVTWAGNNAANVLARARGSYARVFNQAGGDATNNISLPDGGSVTWDDSNSETVDAQLSGYIHANIAKEYVRPWDANLAWLDNVIPVTVNINQTCNAYSDGDSINFFRANQQCGNTARLADVVYHEFGHSLHSQAIIPGVGDFDGSMSEGAGDYLAATITGDPAMGRGFFLTEDPLRHIDPMGSERFYPDDLVGEVHDDGLIYAGAMWDLRKDLANVLGQQAGVEHSDRLFYATLQRAVDMPSSYVEALIEDDDDGDLANGTPNQCSIDRAFALHGLADESQTAMRIMPPVVTGLSVAVEVQINNPECALDIVSATMNWQQREDQAQNGTVTLDPDGQNYVGDIPNQPPGQVVLYQINMELSDGSTVTYPDNAADPMYELFVGEITEIYCTDFETDPADDGWTHALTAGQPGQGADDWQWGVPDGTAGSGDPSAAYSGTQVYGNDLGGGNYNGLYQADKVNETRSPQIDISGYDNIRLQYRRWLNVEDGFFDQGNIYVNDTLAWSNLNSDQGNGSNVHHTDKEWRFHDLDLSPYLQGDTVEIKYEISSDAGLEFGGWTLDDFCVVAYVAPVCGDGQVSIVEECDDGEANSDTAADACRSDCTLPRCGDAVADSGEECDDGNDIDDDECTTACTVNVITGGADAGPGIDGDETGGCCSAGASPGDSLLWALLLLAWLAIPRRRRTAA